MDMTGTRWKEFRPFLIYHDNMTGLFHPPYVEVRDAGEKLWGSPPSLSFVPIEGFRDQGNYISKSRVVTH